ncbi:MAG TPA: hypothetical protein VFU90_01530 [Candidatus Tumulicola sp.]|nr:hypothetical protein [Candidatus Tumulicola sp.]
MGRSRGKSRTEPFTAIPRDVLNSHAFKSLPAIYRALYLDLRRQATPWQNGKIAASDYTLGVFGWSHSTIHKGLALLIEHGLLERTRRGGLGDRGKKRSLYGFTDMAIEADEGRGIRGRLPTYAYRNYKPAKEVSEDRPQEIKQRPRSEPFRSIRCTSKADTVHAVDSKETQGPPNGPLYEPVTIPVFREQIAA